MAKNNNKNPLLNLAFMPQKKGFLGIEEAYLSHQNQAKAIVIPFGLENSVSYKGGTKYGPKAIIKASHQTELFDEEFWCEPYLQYGVQTLQEPEIDFTNISASLHQLASITKQVLDADKFPLILGGEHSITAGSIRPFV